jgi:Presenilin
MPSKVRKSHAASQQEQYDALSQAIARVLFPVMICMALSVFLVHSLGDESKCRTRVRHGDFIAVEGGAGGVDGGSSNLYEGVGGIIFIGVFCAAMVVFTFALLLLYKHGCVKIIFAWLLLAVSLIFAYVGGVYLFEFCRSHCINIDWVTLVFVVWNFTITGLLAIFSTVPRRVNQAYLVVMSALMAYIFRRLPEWSTWTILMVLVAWDLFAVLTPCGPLRMLVKIAQERGDPLPALVYDTNPAAVGRDAEAQPAVVFLSKEEKAKIKADNAARREQKEQAKAAAASLAASTPGAAARRGAASPASALDAPSGGKGDAAGGTATGRARGRPARRRDAGQAPQARAGRFCILLHPRRSGEPARHDDRDHQLYRHSNWPVRDALPRHRVPEGAARPADLDCARTGLLLPDAIHDTAVRPRAPA